MSEQHCGSRLMPALLVAARVGEVRNTAVMRRAMGMPADKLGATLLGRTLRHAVGAGYLKKQIVSTRRCVWTLTERGREAVKRGRIVAMRGMPYTQLEDFFAANPGEELTYRQIAAKFGISLQSARWIAGRLVRAGLAERVLIVRAKPVAERRAA